MVLLNKPLLFGIILIVALAVVTSQQAFALSPLSLTTSSKTLNTTPNNSNLRVQWTGGLQHVWENGTTNIFVSSFTVNNGGFTSYSGEIGMDVYNIQADTVAKYRANVTDPSDGNSRAATQNITGTAPTAPVISSISTDGSSFVAAYDANDSRILVQKFDSHLNRVSAFRTSVLYHGGSGSAAWVPKAIEQSQNHIYVLAVEYVNSGLFPGCGASIARVYILQFDRALTTQQANSTVAACGGPNADITSTEHLYVFENNPLDRVFLSTASTIDGSIDHSIFQWYNGTSTACNTHLFGVNYFFDSATQIHNGIFADEEGLPTIFTLDPNPLSGNCFSSTNLIQDDTLNTNGPFYNPSVYYPQAFSITNGVRTYNSNPIYYTDSLFGFSVFPNNSTELDGPMFIENITGTTLYSFLALNHQSDGAWHFYYLSKSNTFLWAHADLYDSSNVWYFSKFSNPIKLNGTILTETLRGTPAKDNTVADQNITRLSCGTDYNIVYRSFLYLWTGSDSDCTSWKLYDNFAAESTNEIPRTFLPYARTQEMLHTNPYTPFALQATGLSNNTDSIYQSFYRGVQVDSNNVASNAIFSEEWLQGQCYDTYFYTISTRTQTPNGTYCALNNQPISISSGGGGGSTGGGGPTTIVHNEVTETNVVIQPEGSTIGSALGLTVVIPQYRVEPGHSQTQNMIFTWTGSDYVNISSIAFAVHPEWFHVGTTVPFNIYSNQTTGESKMLVPLTVSIPKNVQGQQATIDATIRGELRTGNAAVVTVPVNIIFQDNYLLVYAAIGTIVVGGGTALAYKSHKKR